MGFFERRMAKLIRDQMEPGDRIVNTSTGTSTGYWAGTPCMLGVGEQALYCFLRQNPGGSKTAVVQTARYDNTQSITVTAASLDVAYVARDGVPNRIQVDYDRDANGRRRFHDALRPRVAADRWHEA